MLKLGSKMDMNADHKCIIRLLDDDEVLQFDFKNHNKGMYLLDLTCNQLNLLEKDYFGLRYVDHHKQRHWLDPAKNIMKQIKEMDPIVFCFRVKFYPHEPYKLKEEITRYQMYLQLKRDLQHGRLYCSQSDAALLAAYVVQAELGDYDPLLHVENYVSEMNLLLKQTPELEEKITELHKTQLKGKAPEQSEINFIRKASLLDTYGVDPHPVKDHKGNQLYLGVNHAGILTFQGNRKTHHFKWSDVAKLNYEGKMFIVHLRFNEESRLKKKHTVGFKCPSACSCRYLWRCAVETSLFFTLNSSSEAPSVVTGGSFFSRGSRFRYSGRPEKEILEASNAISRIPPVVNRSSLKRRSTSLPTSPTAPADLDQGLSSRLNQGTPASEPGYIFSEDGCSFSSETPRPGTFGERHVNHLTGSDSHKANNNKSSVLNSVKEIDEATPEVNGFNEAHYYSSYHQYVAEQSKNIYVSSNYWTADTPEDTVEWPPMCDTPTLQSSGVSHNVTYEKSDTFLVSFRNHFRQFRFLRILLPAFLLVIILLSIFLVIVFESKSTLFGPVQRSPEMIIFKKEYYEPLKIFLRERIGL